MSSSRAENTAAPPHPAYHLGQAAYWLARRWALWLRLVVILWLVGLIHPAAARLLPEPPQTVQTNKPILCAHTRLDIEVTDLNVYRTLKMVREMGATTIVELFYWAYMQPDKDRFDWSHPDRIVRMAQEQGLTIIARIGIVPAWARPKNAPLNALPRESYDEFAAFVGAFAARYRDTVRMIIPWNEPNLAFEWGDRLVSPAEYVEFLRLVYQSAHAANPAVLILGGALAPTTQPEGSPNATNDVVFLRRVYEAGGAAYFDALSVHTYGFTLPPEDEPGLDRLNYRRFEMLRAVMREFGDGDKPVYITETSWNDHPRWIHAVRPGQRVKYTLDGLNYAEANWPTVKNVCFWYFRSPVLHRTYQDYFAFVTPAFQPRPIYDEVKRWARGQ